MIYETMRSQDADTNNLTMATKLLHIAGYAFYFGLVMIMFCSFLSPWLAI